MTIMPVEATGGGMATSPLSTTGAKAGEDKQMFLQLLVAQLRYQDPLNPTDSGQFLAQSAQFTALEKMQEVADGNAALLSAQLAFGATSLVGRTVTYADEAGEMKTGTVNGVTYAPAGPTLSVNGSSITLGQVASVSDGSVAPTPPVDPTPTSPTNPSSPADPATTPAP